MNQPSPSDFDPQPSTPEPGIRQQAENSTMGAGMQAAQGNLNIQTLEDENWLFNTLSVLQGIQSAAPEVRPGRPTNQRLLLAEVKHEVTARLKSSLHNAILIDLQKEQQPQQVTRPWDAEIKTRSKPSFPLPDTTSIIEVFDQEEIAGRLLILGAPGSGKTTTLLELATVLITRAENQPDYPIPVLFNLSSWKHDRQSITEWLVVELKSKYGVRADIGKKWVENCQLLPLLDGLDELESARQELCVQAINKLLQGVCRPQYLVVCSRSEEYTNYEFRLQLNGAICLQPPTNTQIRNYLTAINYTELWQTISDEPALLELVRIPLVLSVTIFVYQELSIERWQQLNSSIERFQYLLDAYVHRMLTLQIGSRVYVKQKPPSPRQTRRWLTWLAQQMQKESQTEFLIERMQPTWLHTKVQKLMYHVGISLFFGVSSALAFWLVYDPVYGLIFGLFVGCIFGRIKEIEPVKKLRFSAIKISNGLTIGVFFGLLSGVINGIASGLIIGLVFGMIGGLINGLTSPDVEREIVANQGIIQSAINAGIITLVSWLSLFIVFKILELAFGQLIELFDVLTVGISSALLLSIAFGGLACVQHFILRQVLWWNGYIPWNYAKFLNYATERLFMRRVGGRYHFIHKLLQEYFAQMWSDIAENKLSVLSLLEKRPQTVENIAYALEIPDTTVNEVVQELWQDGYLDTTNSNILSIFSRVSKLRSRREIIPRETHLKLTSKGYFYLHPVIKLN